MPNPFKKRPTDEKIEEEAEAGLNKMREDEMREEKPSFEEN